MGEHKTNETALLRATLPSFPPQGRAFDIELGCTVAPKEHILLVEKDKEVVLPEGKTEAHVMGEPMAPEKCDIIVTVVMKYANLTLATRESVPTGAVGLPIRLARIDFANLVQSCEASLPSQGLVLV